MVIWKTEDAETYFLSTWHKVSEILYEPAKSTHKMSSVSPSPVFLTNENDSYNMSNKAQEKFWIPAWWFRPISVIIYEIRNSAPSSIISNVTH